MKKLLAAAVATTLALGLALNVSAQKIDANGRCHAANGKFAKAAVCSGVKADATADTKAAKADSKAEKIKADAKATKAEAKATKEKTDAKSDATDAKADAKVAKVKCKTAKGKFAKCGTPGATPVT